LLSASTSRSGKLDKSVPSSKDGQAPVRGRHGGGIGRHRPGRQLPAQRADLL